MENQDFNEEIESLDTEPTNEVKDYSNSLGNSLGIDPNVVSKFYFLKKEEIGILPPKKEDNNKPSIIKRILFTVAVLFSLALVGFGVYYYLSMANSKARGKVVPKDLVFDVNTELSHKPEDYATFRTISADNCYVDLNNVDVTKPGKYSYSIVCGNESFPGVIVIRDTTTPEVVLKKVVKSVNETISPEEFIESCNDESDCHYSFRDEGEVNSHLKTPGTYEVSIKVSDNDDNSIYVNAELEVINGSISYYLTCKSNAAFSSDETYAIIYTDSFGIKEDNQFSSSASRIISLMYFDSDSYSNDKGSIKDDTFKDYKGKITYDDDKYIINVESSLTKETLEQENSNWSDNVDDILNIYKNKEYVCTK